MRGVLYQSSRQYVHECKNTIYSLLPWAFNEIKLHYGKLVSRSLANDGFLVRRPYDYRRLDFSLRSCGYIVTTQHACVSSVRLLNRKGKLPLYSLYSRRTVCKMAFDRSYARRNQTKMNKTALVPVPGLSLFNIHKTWKRAAVSSIYLEHYDKNDLTWFSSSLAASACFPSDDKPSPSPIPPLPPSLFASTSALDDAEACQPAFARARYCAIFSCNVYNTYISSAYVGCDRCERTSISDRKQGTHCSFSTLRAVRRWGGGDEISHRRLDVCPSQWSGSGCCTTEICPRTL